MRPVRICAHCGQQIPEAHHPAALSSQGNIEAVAELLGMSPDAVARAAREAFACPAPEAPAAEPQSIPTLPPTLPADEWRSLSPYQRRKWRTEQSLAAAQPGG